MVYYLVFKEVRLVEVWKTELPWYLMKRNIPQASQYLTKLHSLARQVPIQSSDVTGVFFPLDFG